MPSFALLALALAEEPRALCTWTDARWERDVKLRDAEGWPVARLTWSGDARLDARLVDEGEGSLAFFVEVEGGGVAVAGRVDPARERLFQLYGEALPLGGAGTLVPGADLRVLGPGPGGLRVGPDPYALESIAGPAPEATAACGQLTVHEQHLPPAEGALLAAAGLPEDLEAARLLADTPLHAARRGEVLFTLLADEDGREVYVLRAGRRWTAIAEPHWTGVVWYGWVRSEALAPLDPAAGGGMMGILGALGAGPAKAVRTCEAPLELVAAEGGHRLSLGRVLPGTPVEVLADEGEWVSVSLPLGVVYPVSGGRLLVPAEVLSCPEGTWTPPDPFGGLLDGA